MDYVLRPSGTAGLSKMVLSMQKTMFLARLPPAV